MLQCQQVPVLRIPNNDDVRVLRIATRVRGLLIPRGFVWDGASVPAVVQGGIGKPWDCEFQYGSLLHDYLYVTHKATRRNADDWFYNDLRTQGMGMSRAYACWLACHMFGGSRWDVRNVNPETHKFLDAVTVNRLERVQK